jgi:plastocyanin
MGPGETLKLPFAKAGTVKMTCTIHPAMNLTVTVTP